VYILAKENAIAEWRKLMGPTKVYQAIYTHPDSIRGLYGLTDTRNATHGSGTLLMSQNYLITDNLGCLNVQLEAKD
jgi:nucleoside diphosphate kinase